MKDSNSNEQAEILKRLTGYYKSLLITILASCVGWPIFLIGFNLHFNPFTMLLGGALVSAPILYTMFTGGGLSGLFFWQEYEVITTSSTGTKRSDGGSQSFMIGLLFKLFMAVFVIIAGCFATIGKLIFLTIGYFKNYMQIQKKPNFIKSAFPLLILGLTVFVLSGVIVGSFAKKEVSAANTSDYSVKQIREIIASTENKLLSSSYDYEYIINKSTSGQDELEYSVKVSRYNQNNITIVEVMSPNSKKFVEAQNKGKTNLHLGKYTFSDGQFSGYTDIYYENLPQPTKANIELARSYFAEQFIFGAFNTARDSDLFAKSISNDSVTVDFRQSTDQKNRINLNLKKEADSYKITEARVKSVVFKVYYN